MKQRAIALAVIAFAAGILLCCADYSKSENISVEEATYTACSLHAEGKCNEAVSFVESYLNDLGERRDSVMSTRLPFLFLELAECYFVLERYQEADSALLGADAILAAVDDSDSLRAFVMMQRGTFQWMLGNNDVAERLYLDALGMLEARYPRHHAAVMMAYEYITTNYFVNKNWDFFIPFAEHYFQLCLDVYGPCDSVTLAQAEGVAVAFLAMEDKEECREALEIIVRSLDCAPDVHPKYVMDVTGLLGRILVEEGNTDGAIEMLSRSVEAAKYYEQAEAEMLLKTLAVLGNLLGDQSRYAEADSVYEQIVSLAGDTYGPTDSLTIEYRLNYGNILMNLYQLEKADSVISHVLRDAEEVYAHDTVQLIDPLVNYGWLFIVRNEPDEAAPYLTRAKHLADCCCQVGDPDYNWAYKGFTGLLRARGEQGAADSIETITGGP